MAPSAKCVNWIDHNRVGPVIVSGRDDAGLHSANGSNGSPDAASIRTRRNVYLQHIHYHFVPDQGKLLYRDRSVYSPRRRRCSEAPFPPPSSHNLPSNQRRVSSDRHLLHLANHSSISITIRIGWPGPYKTAEVIRWLVILRRRWTIGVARFSCRSNE